MRGVQICTKGRRTGIERAILVERGDNTCLEVKLQRCRVMSCYAIAGQSLKTLGSAITTINIILIAAGSRRCGLDTVNAALVCRAK